MTHVTHVFIKYSHARRKNNNYFIKKVFIKKRVTCVMCHAKAQCTTLDSTCFLNTTSELLVFKHLVSIMFTSSKCHT